MTKKSEIALALAQGGCGAGYAEAVIILCSAISAVAAEAWPGKRKDRARFIELLVQCSSGSSRVVSVPLLVEKLKDEERSEDIQSLIDRLGQFQQARVLTSEDVDLTEEEILFAAPNLSLKAIRSCSYANLLYDEIRSSYVHQYDPGSRANPWPMSRQKNLRASYVNVINRPREIHFHVEWLTKIAVQAASYVDGLSNVPQEDPEQWWIHGESGNL
ncbi:hypothetical protein JF541_19585 [Marinobacter hydrocarbonoclasticus]|uniref:hypothetical protein n=1 Tax=Marinobacter nauticus TaxID=2743 RepID=UPI001A8D0373|nr:hypothetical protein [Marinobacter nauticus]MBN8241361.1 hypothetical protein [Marinobacter nauticus]